MTKFVLVLTIILAAASVLFASGPASAARQTVAGVTFDYPGELPESLPGLVGISPGDEYSPMAVRRSIKLMYLMGMFTDIVVEGADAPGGVLLTYHLVPRQKVDDIDVEGLDELSTKQVLGAMSIKEGDYLDDRLVDKSLAGIRKLLINEGLRDATAEIAVRSLDSLSAELVIYIEEGAPAVVRDISFKGEVALPEDDVRAELEFCTGDVLKKSELELSVDNITALYIDEDYVNVTVDTKGTWYEEGAAHVVITIDAGPRLEVMYDGNRELSDGALTDRLSFWEDRDVSPENVTENLERLTDYYRDEGYYFAAITAQTEESVSPRRVSVKFIIIEGPRASLDEITFTGNTETEDDELLDIMELAVSSVFRSRRITDRKVEEDLKLIKAFYKAKGFLDAEIKADEIRFSDDGKHANLNINISEGVRTYIEDIRFSGNKGVSAQELERLVSVERGAPYNPQMVDEQRGLILNRYSQLGYIHATVEAEEEYSTDKTSLALVFHIDEGIPVHIGRIILRGNLDTRDTVIIRELLFKTGGVYDYEKILRSQQRIFKLGFMSQVKIQPVHPDKVEPVKDLLISVKERAAGSVEFGAGYGEYVKYRGFAEVSYRNMFGYGHRASARGEMSTKESKAVLGYKWPWFWGWPLDFRANLVYLDAEKPNYTIRDFIASAGFDKSFGEQVTASLIYQYERIDLNAPPDAVLAPEDKDKSNIASITPSVIFDYRDNPFDPTSGSTHALILKWASPYLGSTVDFTKLTGQTSWYFPVYNGIVFGISARGGIVGLFSGDFEVPISERFFLGGASSLRGYEFESVAPLGPQGTPTGGDLMALFNAELRFPLPYGFGLVAFLDAGNAWLLNKSTINRDVGQVGRNGLRYGAGAGLRYDTPVGPLRLDYGFKLNPIEGDDQGELHFTLGHAF